MSPGNLRPQSHSQMHAKRAWRRLHAYFVIFVQSQLLTIIRCDARSSLMLQKLIEEHIQSPRILRTLAQAPPASCLMFVEYCRWLGRSDMLIWTLPVQVNGRGTWRARARSGGARAVDYSILRLSYRFVLFDDTTPTNSIKPPTNNSDCPSLRYISQVCRCSGNVSDRCACGHSGSA